MRGKGISMGHSQPKTCSGRKTLKRCKTKGEVDNVVLIDVDSNSFHNVIIIDFPESLPKKLQGSSSRSSAPRKDKNFATRTIICIDDDESTDNSSAGIGVIGSDASSMKSFPASNQSQNSVDEAGDECQFVQKNISPVKLSKCKRTYSGKAATRNRYGLSNESESGSSDHDSLDCEVMEDSFGQVREQWEKAFLKRKNDVRHGQSGMGDQTSSSRFFSDAHQDVGAEDKTERHTEAPVSPSLSKASFEKEGQSPSIATGNGNLGSTSRNPGKTPFSDTDLKSMHEAHFHHRETDIPVRGESFTENFSSNYVECQTHKHFEHGDSSFTYREKYGGSSFHNEEQSPQEPPLYPSHEQGEKQANHVEVSPRDNVKIPQSEHSLSNSDPSGGINFCYCKASLSDEETSSCEGQHAVETEVDNLRFVSRNKDEKFQQTASSRNPHFPNESEHGSSFKENENSVSRESSFGNTQPSVETQVFHGVAPLNEKAGDVPIETFFCKSPPLGKSEVRIERSCQQEKGESVHEKSISRASSFWKTQPSNETQVDHGVAPSNEKVGAVPKETFFCKSPPGLPLGKSEVSIEKGCHQEKGEPVPEELSFCNIGLSEAHLKQGKSRLVESKDVSYEFMSNSQQADERGDLLNAQAGDATPAIESSIIDEREKLKETDEYKRAIEEEWASRQRELKIQAEEAQQLRRLRKRRKAESMRLLDMERRQKQRLEEIRETQKKDEQNMNLKERLRAEVRKELNKLEITCHDMASLLRGLGIHVGGALHPSSHEVRAAYKRALLSFHPDRASGSDIRQQVEAEEKFKLVSRMKEKFLPTS